MRFVLCVVIAALLPVSALGATGGDSMSLSQTQAAAARGDFAGCGCALDHDKPRWLHERVRFPWSSKRSMRQRLSPRPLPHRRRATLLRVKVSARPSPRFGQLLQGNRQTEICQKQAHHSTRYRKSAPCPSAMADGIGIQKRLGISYQHRRSRAPQKHGSQPRTGYESGQGVKQRRQAKICPARIPPLLCKLVPEHRIAWRPRASPTGRAAPTRALINRHDARRLWTPIPRGDHHSKFAAGTRAIFA